MLVGRWDSNYMVKYVNFRHSHASRAGGNRVSECRLKSRSTKAGNCEPGIEHGYASIPNSPSCSMRQHGNAHSGRWDLGAAQSPMGIRASSGIGVLDYRLKMLPGESSYYRSTQSPFCSDGSWKPGIGSLKVQKSAFPGP